MGGAAGGGVGRREGDGGAVTRVRRTEEGELLRCRRQGRRRGSGVGVAADSVAAVGQRATCIEHARIDDGDVHGGDSRTDVPLSAPCIESPRRRIVLRASVPDKLSKLMVTAVCCAFRMPACRTTTKRMQLLRAARVPIRTCAW
jgi:hypothetical protein